MTAGQALRVGEFRCLPGHSWTSRGRLGMAPSAPRSPAPGAAAATVPV